MKTEIISENDNRLLKRKELMLSINYENSATPSKEQLKSVVAELKGVPAENIEIRNIFSEVGHAMGKAMVFVWDGKAPESKKKKTDQPSAKGAS